MSSSEEYILQRKALPPRANNTLFLHLKYTPGDLDFKTIYPKNLERYSITSAGQATYLGNSHGERLMVERLVIAYIRHLEISFPTKRYATDQG